MGVSRAGDRPRARESLGAENSRYLRDDSRRAGVPFPFSVPAAISLAPLKRARGSATFQMPRRYLSGRVRRL